MYGRLSRVKHLIRVLMIRVTHRTLIFCTWGARGAYALTSLTDRGILHVEPVTDTVVQVVEYGDNHIIIAPRRV